MGEHGLYGRLARKQATALSITGLALLLLTAAALAVAGALTQPAGNAGCISETGAGPCADGHGLSGANTAAVSPNGKNVYVASDRTVVRLDRNTGTGAITEQGGAAACTSETGAGPCADGHALSVLFGLSVSPDGKSVYAVAQKSNAVVRFNRDTTTGAITQPAGAAGCISETGAGPCADGHALSGADAVTVSPNGKSVYVTSLGGVVRLKRNTNTGAITQPAGAAGCISETGAGPCADGHGLKDGADSVTVSRDGKSVYVASFVNNAVLRLKRNTTTGAITQPAGAAGCISETGAGPCVNGRALTGAVSVVVSRDGNHVYVAANTGDAVARFNRNRTTGAIAQPAGAAGCISETGAGPCADGHALVGPLWLSLSPDGRNIYAASHKSDAVTRLNRNPSSGGLTQATGAAGCISETGSGPCADGHALFSPLAVAVSADGKSVYAASLGSNAVARINRAP
ncbi:MAG TPA: beta-propeller fold lactonase family protein [Thermoleophilaceae bacterium]|nr:beta-propeller fold lactonase family protein [Thermoleophilaceae bacterium]